MRGICNWSAQRDRLESRQHRAGRVHNVEVTTADAVGRHLLDGLQEALLLLHTVRAGHPGGGHRADLQPISVDLEAAGRAIAPAMTRQPWLGIGEDEIWLPRLVRHLHRHVAQAHQLPVGVAQGAVGEAIAAHLAWPHPEEALDHQVRPGQLAGGAAFAALSPRERQVLALIAEGLSNKDIAERLQINEKTVRNHASNLFDKLGVWSRAQAIVFARERGYLG